MSASKGYNRRLVERLKVNIISVCRVTEPVVLLTEIGTKLFEANVIDLSKEGAALISPYALPVDSKLYIKFVLYQINLKGEIDLYDTVKILARVKYCHYEVTGDLRVGVKFEKALDKATEKRMEELLNTITLKDSTPAESTPKILF